MQKYGFVMLVLSLAFAVHAQEQTVPASPVAESGVQSAVDSTPSPPVSLETALQPIMHRGGFFAPFEYKYMDGTKLSDRDVNRQLRLLPENAAVMKKADAWHGIALALLAGALGAVATNMVAADLNCTKTATASAVTGICALCAGTLCAEAYQSYRSVAVDAYNLRVLGVKAP